jgi:hypothetical protein
MLWALAVLSMVTVVQRILHVYVAFRREERGG